MREQDRCILYHTSRLLRYGTVRRYIHSPKDTHESRFVKLLLSLSLRVRCLRPWQSITTLCASSPRRINVVMREPLNATMVTDGHARICFLIAIASCCRSSSNESRAEMLMIWGSETEFEMGLKDHIDKRRRSQPG